ncbi:MAG: GFA family protein [Arenicellales bacterium]
MWLFNMLLLMTQDFHDLGYQKLKNIAETVRVYALYISDLKGFTHPTAFLNSRLKEQPLFDLNGAASKQGALTTGGCLCGAVRYEVSEPDIGTGFCHCRICQRALGAPVNAWVGFPLRSVKFPLSKPSYYRSTMIAKRGFCSTCGTILAYQMLKPSISEYLIICIPTLDRPEDFPPVWHGGIESQLPWLNVHDDLPRLRTS